MKIIYLIILFLVPIISSAIIHRTIDDKVVLSIDCVKSYNNEFHHLNLSSDQVKRFAEIMGFDVGNIKCFDKFATLVNSNFNQDFFNNYSFYSSFSDFETEFYINGKVVIKKLPDLNHLLKSPFHLPEFFKFIQKKVIGKNTKFNTLDRGALLELSSIFYSSIADKDERIGKTINIVNAVIYNKEILANNNDYDKLFPGFETKYMSEELIKKVEDEKKLVELRLLNNKNELLNLMISKKIEVSNFIKIYIEKKIVKNPIDFYTKLYIYSVEFNFSSEVRKFYLEQMKLNNPNFKNDFKINYLDLRKYFFKYSLVNELIAEDEEFKINPDLPLTLEESLSLIYSNNKTLLNKFEKRINPKLLVGHNSNFSKYKGIDQLKLNSSNCCFNSEVVLASKYSNKSNEPIGYIDFGSQMSDEYHNRIIDLYFFERPDWNSKSIIKKLEMGSFKYESGQLYASEKYLVYEVDNFWLKLLNIEDKKYYWVHSEMVGNFSLVEDSYKGSPFIVSVNLLQDKINGKFLINKDKKEVQLVIEIIENKRVNDNLWIKAKVSNYYDEEIKNGKNINGNESDTSELENNQSIQKEYLKKLPQEFWFRAFDNDGKPSANYMENAC